MEQPEKPESAHFRLLGLGNDLLADDAFGILAAHEAERLLPGRIEVVCSSAAGFNLLEHVLGVARVVVLDTITTDTAKPGTLHVFRVDQLPRQAGIAPHFLGLFEVLGFARQLHLDVAQDAVVIAVEASDCTTIGGDMHPDVQSAIARAVDLVKQFVAGWGQPYAQV